MGQEVNWFPRLQFSFDTNHYVDFIESFKKELV